MDTIRDLSAAACASVFRSSGKRARQIYFIIAFYRVEYVFCGMAHVLCESVKWNMQFFSQEFLLDDYKMTSAQPIENILVISILNRPWSKTMMHGCLKNERLPHEFR